MPERDFDSWMWETAENFLDRFQRLQRLMSRPATSSAWQPPVDLFETDDALWVVLTLPGVDPTAVELSFEGGWLLVRGVRSLPKACQKATVHRMELPYGPFERRIELPPGRYEAGERSLDHGCLIVALKRLP